jgi:Ca2+-binding RTX toxin-like protein
LWDHGLGVGGVCSASNGSGSTMSMMGVTQALNSIVHLDLLGFDACLMGMAEVATQFVSYADVMVSSEQLIPGTGYDYSFLGNLKTTPSMSAAAFGACIVDAYAAFYGQSSGQTLAEIDLSKIGNSSTGLVGALESFTNIMLTKGTQKDWDIWKDTCETAFEYIDTQNAKAKPFPAHDIVELMTDLCDDEEVSAYVRSAAQNVINAHNACVLKLFEGNKVTAHGLDVFTPVDGDEDLWDSYNSDLSFLNDTQWALLAGMFGTFQTSTAKLVAGDAANQVNLCVFGTNSNDTFYFEQLSGGRIKLTTSMKGCSQIFKPSKGKYINAIFVYAWGGNDTITFASNMTHVAVIYCGAGNDTVTTRSGNDYIHGGPGNDIINSGQGNDQIAGGDGNDQIYGGIGNDRINGGAGNDKLVGNAGNDALYGDRNADTLFGDTGSDVLIGGAGNDSIHDASGSNCICGGPGDDRLFGGNNVDLIYGSIGNDILVGGKGDDMLFGGLGANLLIGGLGTDQLRSRNNNNILIGGCTNYDANEAALIKIMQEWARPIDRATRIAHLMGTLSGGYNGTFYLRKDGDLKNPTVFSDDLANLLYGDEDKDWILAFKNDKVYPSA